MKIARIGVLTLVALLAQPALAVAAGPGVQPGCVAGQVFTSGNISVTGAFSRAMLPGAKTAGGYFSIANAGTAPDTLTGATSAAAPDVQLHQMSMHGDVMEMAPVEGGLVVPAGGSVALAPSGLHLMLTGMAAPFKEGECLELVLHFDRAGDLPLVLNVGGPAQAEAPAGDMGHMDMSGMDMSSQSH